MVYVLLYVKLPGVILIFHTKISFFLFVASSIVPSKLAKSSKKPQEMLVKGPTKRWMQVKDTVPPSGNILKSLIDNGITVGVSSRGMGSLRPMGEVQEVQDDFELLCWDFVSTPSNPDSFMHLVT